ncbi:hypothetical protein [Paenibacillus pini]|nr:hypothetical protein [Paenibacillus pini]
MAVIKLNSRINENGYEIIGRSSTKAPTGSGMLETTSNSGSSTAGVALFRIQAKLQKQIHAVPSGSQLILEAKNWRFYASDAIAPAELMKLKKEVIAYNQFAAPVADSTGIVHITKGHATGDGSPNYKYHAEWSFGDETTYSFEATTTVGLTQFKSMLSSFRPVINLLDQADVVLLPTTQIIRVQEGKRDFLLSNENKKVPIAASVRKIKGVLYIPLKDVVRAIQGNMQYVTQKNGSFMYLSQRNNMKPTKLNLKTGTVYRNEKKLATYSLVTDHGTLMVPVTALSKLLDVQADKINTENKTMNMTYTSWYTSNTMSSESADAQYQVKVFSLVGPSFEYNNTALGSSNAWEYAGSKPPKGYSPLKYEVSTVHIPLVPGSQNRVELQTNDGQMKIVQSVNSTIDPNQVPFQLNPLPYLDGLNMNVQLVSDAERAWKGGYAEAVKDVMIRGDLKGSSMNSLRLNYKYVDKNGKVSTSNLVNIAATDQQFSYTLKPEKGKGTYIVSLVSPPKSYPLADQVTIVTFMVVFK